MTALEFFMIELPSNIPFDSIIKSVEVISPLTRPAAFISTLLALTVPSIKPCTTKRSVYTLPFTRPFLPIFTSLEDFTEPSSSPSIYKLQERFSSPLSFAPAVIIVVFELV